MLLKIIRYTWYHTTYKYNKVFYTDDVGRTTNATATELYEERDETTTQQKWPNFDIKHFEHMFLLFRDKNRRNRIRW